MRQELSITEGLFTHYMDLVAPIDGNPLGLLLPAGTERRVLPIIAAGLKQIPRDETDLIVLLTSNAENQIKAQTKGEVQSQLGPLEIDAQAGSRLLKVISALKPEKLSPKNTSTEISAAFPVLLPFIKSVFPGAKILPVFLPAANFEGAEILGSALKKILEDRQAIVIAQAELEPGLLSTLEFNNPETFQEYCKERIAKSSPGASAAGALLQYAVLSGGNTVTILEEGRPNAAHPAAVMLWDYQPPQLSASQKDELFRLAIQAIDSHVKQGETPIYECKDPMLERKAGVFVTIRINGKLRGCIGNMSALHPLYHSVPDMAVAAATSDPRFPPLTAKEVEQITIKVAILSPMQRMEPDQIVVGKHGVLISSAGKRGVLLPEVAAERGWNTETFLENVCQKAGLPEDSWKQGAKIYGFSSVVFGNGSRSV